MLARVTPCPTFVTALSSTLACRECASVTVR